SGEEWNDPMGPGDEVGGVHRKQTEAITQSRCGCKVTNFAVYSESLPKGSFCASAKGQCSISLGWKYMSFRALRRDRTSGNIGWFSTYPLQTRLIYGRLIFKCPAHLSGYPADCPLCFLRPDRQVCGADQGRSLSSVGAIGCKCHNCVRCMDSEDERR